MTVRTLLLSLLAICGLAYAMWWARVAWSRFKAPSPILLAIGFVTNFFDTLGIGSFAPTTTAFKMLRLVPDEHIPGTMIVGHSLPVVAQALIFIAVVPVESVTLLSITISTIVGGWLGAGVVSKLPRRGIQAGMGVALLLAALFMAMSQLELFPGAGEALGLSGLSLAVAIVVTFVLGGTLMLGIGHYGPSLVLYSLLGMDPRAAFPIMMGSGGFVGPAGAVRFLKSGRYDLRAAIGLAVAGVPAVLIAAYIVRSLPLYVLRWMVVVVVVYAGVGMLRSAMTEASAETLPSQS
jgi:uncharacterized membrane protein YfcA